MTQRKSPEKQNNKQEQWDLDKCREAFMRTDDLTIKDLSKVSGVSVKRLTYWSRQGKWPLLREAQQKLNLQPPEKHKNPIDEVDRSFDTREENLKCLVLIRDFAKTIVSIHAKELNNKMTAAQSNTELVQYAKTLNTPDIIKWMDALRDSVTAIEETMGLQYITDINAEYRRLESEGYVIVESSVVE